VLLFDRDRRELRFEIAEGESERALKHMKLSARTGVAGWVARNKQPLIINDVTGDTRFTGTVDEVTGFTTRSMICAPLIVQRKVIGVIEVLNKQDGSEFTNHDLETLMSVASTAAMALENAQLQEAILDVYKSTIKALAAAIDAKDHYTCGHSQRVVEYALMGGTALSLSREQMEVLEYAAILHDVGKIGIADGILSKAGYLTEEEWAVMRQHPQIGYDILKDVPFLENVRELILRHHEWFDGSGYPHGIKEEDIPVGARVLAIADAFDTMTTDRAYRAAVQAEGAIAELNRFAGRQFCPKAVQAFISSYQARGTEKPCQQ
jgi:HD-GYP domain-containing protein (c-di-GMP phosphodiesterase class II)